MSTASSTTCVVPRTSSRVSRASPVRPAHARASARDADNSAIVAFSAPLVRASYREGSRNLTLLCVQPQQGGSTHRSALMSSLPWSRAIADKRGIFGRAPLPGARLRHRRRSECVGQGEIKSVLLGNIDELSRQQPVRRRNEPRARARSHTHSETTTDQWIANGWQSSYAVSASTRSSEPAHLVGTRRALPLGRISRGSPKPTPSESSASFGYR